MRPSHHLGILRGCNRLLEIILRAVPVLVGHGYFRQNEQRPALVANLFIQRLLCQFLRSFGIACR